MVNNNNNENTLKKLPLTKRRKERGEWKVKKKKSKIPFSSTKGIGKLYHTRQKKSIYNM
jgi:hypothetical protein